jgi:predicted nucleic acid-binding protein
VVCLDSDVLISFLRGDAAAVEAVRTSKGGEEEAGRKKEEGEGKREGEEEEEEEGSAVLRTTVVNEYELLKGAAASVRKKENLSLVRGLLASLEVLPLDDDSCEIAARLYGDIRAEGKNATAAVNEFDLLVAAIALRNGEVLVTRDERFKAISGLQLRRW